MNVEFYMEANFPFKTVTTIIHGRITLFLKLQTSFNNMRKGCAPYHDDMFSQYVI